MRVINMRNKGKSYLVGLAMGGLLLAGLPAFAQPGPGPGYGRGMGPCGRGMGPGYGRGMGPGYGRGMGFGPGRGGVGRCGGMLMWAHPDLLKAELGLNDTQVARVKAIRDNLAAKRIKLQAEVNQLRLQQAQLYQADLPDQNKALALMRKVRAARGRLAEERVKAHTKVLAALTKEQRALVRTRCGAGWGRWAGRGMGQGWGGRGRGWGGRGRGWGRGPGWGPGWAE